ncbi:hypothetical protein BASA62_006015 [Batrachochytrium salamandrivorans]|nr:hypothetical protein BASA62_006015 [Batrachochytrium salamandrivorans]
MGQESKEFQSQNGIKCKEKTPDPAVDENKDTVNSRVNTEASERMKQYRNNTELANMLYNNGISETTFVSKIESITSIEMCHYNFPVISHLSYFPYLTTLYVVAQDVKSMFGLETCVHLVDLWICETRINTISGLEFCTKLKRLFLYSNRIKKIDGISMLKDLEQLWLCDNEITSIENLTNLKKLSNLQLGNNCIVNIGNSLNDNLSLQVLNLSGNRIFLFREILNLTRLPLLTHLCLSDPNYADNPICSLCNYQTHMVYHFQKLKSLDTLEVSEESRRIISATVLKKRMYYNMRIRTICRNTNFLVKKLYSLSADNQETIERDLKLLVDRSKKVQRRIDALAIFAIHDISMDQSLSEKLNDALFQINSAIEFKTQTQIKLLAHHRDIDSRILNQSDMAIRKLLLELETGGNVRFEEEEKNALWVSECENLVKMFIKRGASKNSPRAIQIHRISRLHNRHMKLRFSETYERLGDLETPLPLCVQGYQSNPDDAFSVIEHGFQLTWDTAEFSNNLLLANFLNFQEEKNGDNNTSESHVGKMPKRVLRQVIIVQALVKNSKMISNSTDSIHTVKEKAYPGQSAVYQNAPLHTKIKENIEFDDDIPKEYCVFNRDILLPEFYIEYSIENDLDQYETPMERLLIDVAHSSYMSHSDIPGIVRDLEGKLKDETKPFSLMANDTSMEKLESDHPEIIITNVVEQSDTELMEKTLETSSTSLEHLNISGQSALNPESYSQHTKLRSLTISHSSLVLLQNIPKLPLLERLDLSFNNIKVICSGFELHHNLTFLGMAGNQIEGFDTLKYMFRKLCNLVELDLRFNPICKRKGYRVFCSVYSPKLQILDGIQIKPSEKEITDWSNLLNSRSTSQRHLFRSLSIRTEAGYGSSSAEHDCLMPLSVKPRELIRPEMITTLQLDSCNLFELDILPKKMVSLRWASFRNNNLQDISRLENYHFLEELSLEKNDIQSIDALGKLEFMTKLNASNNRISLIDCNEGFKSVRLLSLESNLIKSLQPFSKMTSLMELYIGNNHITDMFGIFPLKNLPRLIVLDLIGSPVCQISNYRLFLVFHLIRLKILDGAGIVAKEHDLAKEEYMGKLTIELLGEKIGHFTFKHILELDLRNCKIREIDCLARGDFRNLRRLNFDNNLLTNIDGFTSLSGLRYLSLNSNKIERLLLADIASPTPLGSLNSLYGSGVNGVENEINNASLRYGIGPKKEFTGESGNHKIVLPQLEELYLGHNQISKMADLGLSRFPKLKILHLQGNKISKIDGLEHMTSMVELILDKNHIKGADSLSFISLINLKGASYQKMKLPSLREISLLANVVARKQMYRTSLLIRFPQIISIDGKEISNEEQHRAHVYCFEQNLLREDNVTKLALGGIHNSQGSLSSIVSGSAAKLPIKITSVGLDGLEMRLSVNSSSYGLGTNIHGVTGGIQGNNYNR